MTGIPEGQDCLVKLGGRWHEATVTTSLPKRYVLAVKGYAEPVTVGQAKVMPARQKPALLLPNDKPGMQRAIEAVKRGDILAVRRELLPVPKPDKPELVPVYMHLVRKRPCCNCKATSNIEAHHEGHKGIGQKVRDTMTVPLCSYCHRWYTDTNCLPDPFIMAQLPDSPRPALLTREESLVVLQLEQEFILDHVLAKLSRDERIEAKSKAVAYLKPSAIAGAWGGP